MATRLSMENLREKFQLSEEQLDQELSEKHLLEVSRFMEDHETISNELGLSASEIHAINCNTNEQECRRQKTLRKWKEISAWMATYKKIIDAFLKCSRGDLACKVCELLTQPHEEEHSPSVRSAKSNNVPSSTSSPPEPMSEADDIPWQTEKREDELRIGVKGTPSLLELPCRDADIEIECKKLLGLGNLENFVEDLECVGKYIRVACYGAKAAGPKFAELHTEVQDLGFDVAKLCDKSASTISKFKNSCTKVLSILEATYEYLLNNMEEMALGSLKEVSITAHKMVAAAEELHRHFEEEEGKVRRMVMKSTLISDQQAQAYEEEYRALDLKLAHQQRVLEDVRKAEELSAMLYRKYEMRKIKEVEELQDQKSGIVGFVNAITSSCIGIQVFGEQEEVKGLEVKQSKIEALRFRKRMDDIRMELYRKRIEFTDRIKKCVEEGEMAKAVNEALFVTVYGLKVLAKLMMQVGLFWKHMEQHCDELEEHQLKKTVMTAMERLTPTKRRTLWTSKPVKKYANEFYAGWVALDRVCGGYMIAIEETRKNIQKYITDSPAYGKPTSDVTKVTEELWNELDKAQKATAQRQFETTKEIETLSLYNSVEK